MYLSRNNKSQIIEIVQKFCEDCLGRKLVIKKENRRKGKTSAESIHYMSLSWFTKMVLMDIDVTVFLINMSSI